MNNKRTLAFIKKHSKKLSNYLANAQTAENDAFNFEVLPEETRDDVAFAFISSLREASERVTENYTDKQIEQELKNEFLSKITQIKDDKTIDIISKYFELDCTKKTTNQNNNINTEFLKEFYRHYYEFYRRSDTVDADKMRYIMLLATNDDFINDFIQILSSHSINITFTLKPFQPLDITKYDIDNFKKNIIFMCKFYYLLTSRERDWPPVHLFNFLVRDDMKSVSPAIFDDWFRQQYIYDFLGKGFNLKNTNKIDKAGEILKKNFKICLNHERSDIRKQVRKDYRMASALIEHAANGTFPG